MPKEITEIKAFLQKARQKDAKLVTVMTLGQKPNQITKFKIRCAKYLWTLKVTDASKATKLKQSLPPGLPRKDLGTK